MTRARTFISDFSIYLGAYWSIRGSLVPLRVPNSTKATSLKTLCPDCAETGVASAVHERYFCDEGHGPFISGECGKGKEISKGQYEILTAQQVEDLKITDTPKDVLPLSVHPAEDFDRATWHDGTAYVFVPKEDGLNLDSAATLRVLVDDESIVFAGVTNIRGSEKFVRLDVAPDGNIIVQGLIWPEDLAERDGFPDRSLSDADVDMARMLVARNTQEFDPAMFASATKAKHAEIVRALSSGNAAPQPRPQRQAKPQMTLAELLEMSLRETS